MSVETQSEQRFDNLATITDQLHALFDLWEIEETFSPLVSVDSLVWLRLAVHEWVANLVQHADFRDRPPCVAVRITADGKALRCVVKDNSDGFDLWESFPEDAATRFEQMPDRGMGLVLLERIAETLDYAALSPHEHRLVLTVRAAAPVMGSTGDSGGPEEQGLPYLGL